MLVFVNNHGYEAALQKASNMLSLEMIDLLDRWIGPFAPQ